MRSVMGTLCWLQLPRHLACCLQICTVSSNVYAWLAVCCCAQVYHKQSGNVLERGVALAKLLR